MALTATKWRFTRQMIIDAPAHPGIYALWDNDSLIRLGWAQGRETIRSKLLALLGAGGTLPTHYSWEIHQDPVARAKQLVRAMESG